MNIHKFNVKPKTTPSKAIHWQQLREVTYPAIKVNSMTWEIFSQEDIKLKPKEVKQLQLGLGFMMSEGVVLTALDRLLKNKRCSLQNEVSLEDTEDIIITITNNPNEIVDIEKHKLLCRVCYKKNIIVLIKWKRKKYIQSYQQLHPLKTKGRGIDYKKKKNKRNSNVSRKGSRDKRSFK